MANQPEQQFPQSRFATKVIGPEGGTVELYGVSLVFPPGALLDQQEIKLGIIWETSHQPDVGGNKAMLSPVVSCEPHGLQFQKPVKLVMPHCAAAAEGTSLEDAWKFIPMKSETDLKEQVNWEEAAPPGDQSGTQVTKTHITMDVHHFTIFTALGEIR